MSKGINSKAKGNRVELEMAKILTKRFNLEFSRTPASGAFATNKRGSDLRKDVIDELTGDLIVPKSFKFSIEVKSRKAFNFFDFFNKGGEIHEWLKQCEEDAEKSGKLPLLIVKINYHEPFVMVKFPIKISDMLFQKWQIITLEHFLEIDDNEFFDNDIEEVLEIT